MPVVGIRRERGPGKEMTTMRTTLSIGMITVRSFRRLMASSVMSGVLVLASIGVTGAAKDARAQAQDLTSLTQQLQRLERDIQTLSKIVSRGGASGGASVGEGADAAAAVAAAPAAPAATPLPEGAAARLGVRLDTLEGDLRRVTGGIEEMNFAVRQVKKQVERLTADVEFRLTGIEQQIGLQGAQQPVVSSGPANTPVSAVPAAGEAADGAVTVVQGVKPPAQVAAAAGQGGGAAKPAAAAGAQIASAQARSLGTVSQKAVAEIDGKEAAPAPGATASRPQTASVPVGGGTQTARLTNTKAPPLPDGSPDEQYKYAFGLLRKHNFDHAEAAFNEFIETHPDDKLVGNARYWLGETHYARGNFVNAAKIFLKGYENDPKGSKAPDSLLKLGMSLGELGEKEKACGAFGKLFADYPDLGSSLKRTATRQQRRLACP